MPLHLPEFTTNRAQRLAYRTRYAHNLEMTTPRELTHLLVATCRAQAQLTRQNVEDLRPLFTMPLVAFVSVAVLLQSGRAHLAPYGVVAAVLMTIGQMGNFVASEVVYYDRQEQLLELMVASPGSYFFVLLARVVTLTLLGLFGALESWVLVRVCFGIALPVHHPWAAAGTLIATALAAAGTALLTSALFAMGGHIRTMQNAINGPLYLLAGVLVPASYLPPWIQHASPFVFLYWSANMLRASLSPAAISAPLFGVMMILTLGVVTGALGYIVLERMLTHLRRTGALALI
jgi:ABC-2 type transport system permease protein